MFRNIPKKNLEKLKMKNLETLEFGRKIWNLKFENLEFEKKLWKLKEFWNVCTLIS